MVDIDLLGHTGLCREYRLSKSIVVMSVSRQNAAMRIFIRLGHPFIGRESRLNLYLLTFLSSTQFGPIAFQILKYNLIWLIRYWKRHQPTQKILIFVTVGAT